MVKKTNASLLIIFLIAFSVMLGQALLKPKSPFDASPQATVEQTPKVRNTTNKIVLGALDEVINKTTYRSAYYSGGYPPTSEGVCTDVVWRALKNAGFNLKNAIDKDIKQAPSAYKNSVKKPDPNIDFRRVKNQLVYFKRHFKSLTMKLGVNDEENLAQWKPGDIVVFKSPDHVAVVSDLTNASGVPYIIQNNSGHASEDDVLEAWYSMGRVVGHFRYVAN